MNLSFKNVFLSVGMFVFALGAFGLVNTSKAEAAITAAQSGPWSTAATWTGDTVPTTEDVIIPSGVVVTVTAGAAAASLTINNAGAATGVTISDGITLAVSGAVTLNAPSVNGTSTIAIGAGTLTAGSLAIAGGDGTKISQVTITNGTLTVTNDVVLSGTATNAKLTSTGDSAISVTTGNLTNGGTIAFTGAGTTFSVSTGTTTTSNGASITLSDTAGTYTFTGVFALLAGGEYEETVPGTAVTFSGAINNAGTMTVSTAGHTFTGNITNTGVGIFNYAGSVTLTKLQAATTAGTVNYTGAGQAIQVIGYHNLGLSGSGTKTTTDTLVIGGALAISGTAKASLTGASSTANTLTLGGVSKILGSWGPTGSTATRINDTYFAGTGKVTVTAGTEGGNAGNRSGGTQVIICGPSYTLVSGSCVLNTTTTTPTTTTEVTTTTTTTTTEPVGGCSAGNLFNTQTGNACVNNPAVPEGCGGGKLFSPVTGVACPVSTSTTVTTTTTTTTYNLGTVTLKNGSKGEAVKELQRFLNAKLSLGLVVDGKLGPKTIAVIKTWQGANGLVADGLVGAKTKAEMNK